MPPSSTESAAQRLFGKLHINPYEPPHTQSRKGHTSTPQDAFIVPVRFNWLTVSMLAVSLLSTIAIYLYHSRGIGRIGDPILATLASTSAVWIPLYRMASPSVVLFMPRGCRTTFGTCHLLGGLLCCINDFGSIYAGSAIVVESIGMHTAFALCIVLASAVFAVELALTRHRLALTRNALGWLAATVCIHGAFYVVGLMI